jgi:ATP-dependent RNA helicase DeaD
MVTKLFSELGLSAEVLKAIDKLGFEQAAPIQAEAIPVLMQGHDVVGQSQTGSGKTAAFAIPAIEKTDPRQRAVQVLILCPTRELAVQVSEEVHKLALFKRGIHALPIYGGQSYERQFQGLKQGAQIVIGTPGRLMDHMRRHTLELKAVRMVILDEADVMLDMGFRDDIEFILQAVAKERQTVFFSATMPGPIQELIRKYARDPVSVRIEQKTVTVPTVEQVYYEVDRRFKIELLTRLVDIYDYKLGIIFCNTKRMVDDLVDHLEAQGYSADRLHGDMSQAMRDRVMNKFRKSGLEFLVATDVAARGIDVDDVQVVFNYDLPYDVQDYVHRIGRTGRAGRSGRAISFVAGREVFQIQQIERYTRTRVHRARIPTPGEVEEARASAFLDKLRTILGSGQYKKQDHLIERLLEEGFNSTDIASALIHQLQAGDPAPETRTDSFATRPGREERRPQRLAHRGAPLPAKLLMPTPKENRPAPRDQTPGEPPKQEARQDSAPATAVQPPPPVSPKATGSKSEPLPIVLVPAKVPVATSEEYRPAPRDRMAGERAKQEVHQGKDPATAVRSTPLTSPKPTGPKAEPLPRALVLAKPPVPTLKDSPPTRQDRTRLHINMGAEMGVTAGDIALAISGETGLPATVVGVVDIRDRHLFVEVASEHAKAIIAKLNRTQIKGRKLKVKVA